MAKGCKIPPPGGENGAGEQDASLSRSIDDGPPVDTKGSADMTSSTSEKKEGTNLGESAGCSSKGTAGRKTEETEIPASVLEFFELNHRAMLGKGQTADGSGGSASLEAGNRQSDCGQNAIGRQEYDLITTPAPKRSRPRHSTSANEGTIEKSSSRFCWRSRIYDCGCEECDQESELDEEEAELVSEVCLGQQTLVKPVVECSQQYQCLAYDLTAFFPVAATDATAFLVVMAGPFRGDQAFAPPSFKRCRGG
jgi:hypothetical protein